MKSESVAQALLSLASEMEADVPESVNQVTISSSMWIGLIV